MPCDKTGIGGQDHKGHSTGGPCHLKDIGTMLRGHTGGEGESLPWKRPHQHAPDPLYSKDGKSLVDTTIALDTDTDEVLGYGV